MRCERLGARSSGGESREIWTAPGGSVAAPERSGKVSGGFGGVLTRFYEVWEGPRGERILRGPRISGPLRGRKVGR